MSLPHLRPTSRKKRRKFTAIAKEPEWRPSLPRQSFLRSVASAVALPAASHIAWIATIGPVGIVNFGAPLLAIFSSSIHKYWQANDTYPTIGRAST